MPEYRRWYVPGGTYYFTLVTCRRAPVFQDRRAVKLLGSVLRECRTERPLATVAMVVLPDHLHCVWVLPAGDSDYSGRWKWLKARFSRLWLSAGGRENKMSRSRLKKRERGVWQRRFWEHVVRDDDDLERCCDYIHYNPVKHGYVSRPIDWRPSTFARYAKAGHYPRDWGRSEPAGLRFFGHPE